MIPVKQEFIHDPENGQYGDCHRATIASLLELPIDQVPHFGAASKMEPTKFWELTQAFLMKHGVAMFEVPARSGGGFFGLSDEHKVHHIISGPSPRGGGVTHSVIGLDGRIVFDPHPDNTGLVGESDQWTYSFLVQSRPAKGSQNLLPARYNLGASISDNRLNVSVMRKEGDVITVVLNEELPIASVSKGGVIVGNRSTGKI